MLPARQVAVLLLVVAASASVVFAEDTTTSFQYQAHHPPLLHCSTARSKNDDGAFRANLASALGALPSAAAAAPKGFATARSGGAGRDRAAFARGLCLGTNTSSSPAAARACRACLSAAARDVTRGCGPSRRAGVWRAGCFLAYADADAAPAGEDAFRGWFYVAPNTMATPDRACAGDLPAAGCARCYEDSLRAAAASVGWLPRLRGGEVLVVGYSCCVRVRVSVPPQGQWPRSQLP